MSIPSNGIWHKCIHPGAKLRHGRCQVLSAANAKRRGKRSSRIGTSSTGTAATALACLIQALSWARFDPATLTLLEIASNSAGHSGCKNGELDVEWVHAKAHRSGVAFSRTKTKFFVRYIITSVCERFENSNKLLLGHAIENGFVHDTSKIRNLSNNNGMEKRYLDGKSKAGPTLNREMRQPQTKSQSWAIDCEKILCWHLNSRTYASSWKACQPI